MLWGCGWGRVGGRRRSRWSVSCGRPGVVLARGVGWCGLGLRGVGGDGWCGACRVLGHVRPPAGVAVLVGRTAGAAPWGAASCGADPGASVGAATGGLLPCRRAWWRPEPTSGRPLVAVAGRDTPGNPPSGRDRPSAFPGADKCAPTASPRLLSRPQVVPRPPRAPATHPRVHQPRPRRPGLAAAGHPSAPSPSPAAPKREQPHPSRPPTAKHGDRPHRPRNPTHPPRNPDPQPKTRATPQTTTPTPPHTPGASQSGGAVLAAPLFG